MDRRHSMQTRGADQILTHKDSEITTYPLSISFARAHVHTHTTHAQTNTHSRTLTHTHTLSLSLSLALSLSLSLTHTLSFLPSLSLAHTYTHSLRTTFNLHGVPLRVLLRDASTAARQVAQIVCRVTHSYV